jgi:energy-coupling factor transporter transmembrane protein EcfT
MAFSETGVTYGLTSTDAFVATSPLILISFTVIIISIRSFLKLPTRKIYTMLPLLLLLFFMTILIDSEAKDDKRFSGTEFLSQTQVGFYLLLLSAVFLPLTKNHRRKKTRKPENAGPQVAF